MGAILINAPLGGRNQQHILSKDGEFDSVIEPHTERDTEERETN